MSNAILLDGAAGTTLWEYAERDGFDKVPVWRYNIEHPEIVAELHEGFIQAGSKMIQTNTFAANGPAVKRSSDYSVEQVVTAAVKIAKDTIGNRDVSVYASFGPLSTLLKPYGPTSAEEAEMIFNEMVTAAYFAGTDCIVWETFMDLEMMKLAVRATKKYDIPVFCSMSFEKRMRTMMGNTVKSIAETLEPMGIDAIGMNCSHGPVDALPIIEEFRKYTDLPLYFKPNAGLPVVAEDGTMVKPYTAETFASEVAPALEFVSYVGGCCGCDDAYIRELGRLLKE